MKSLITLSLATLATVASAAPGHAWGGPAHSGGRTFTRTRGAGAPVASSSSIAACSAVSVAISSTTEAAAVSSSEPIASSSVAVSSASAVPTTSAEVASSSVATSSAVVAASSIAVVAAAASTSTSTPIVYLAGDSTMAVGGGGTGTEGWGVFLPYSLSGVTVVNDAVAGRSARSYTDEDRFQDIADVVTSNDYVIIEFGHNDGGSLTPTDNLRSDCVGAGDETCTTDAGVVVQTYPTYIIAGAELMTAKGAHVIIASPTPDNPCESGTCEYTASRFTAYGNASAATVGSLASFVDHGQYVADAFEALGVDAVDDFYPNDHTHPSPEGSTIVAAQFVLGLLCGDSPLAAYVVNTTDSIGTCL